MYEEDRKIPGYFGPRLSDLVRTQMMAIPPEERSFDTGADNETRILRKEQVMATTPLPNDPYLRSFVSGVVEEELPPTQERIAHHIGQILDALGYSRTDQHFMKTPERAAAVLLEYARNGNEDKARELLEVQFTEPGAISSLILEGPIRYISRCAHHLEPVDGWAWVGYLPSDCVCGLSKLARIVNFYAMQLTVQERVTQEIADALVTHLHPGGVMVVIEADHGCMKRRGVMEPSASTTTSAIRGVFHESATARNEFLSLMKEPPK